MVTHLDFTQEKYEDICEAIVRSGYATITFQDYLQAEELPRRFIIVRHDIDRNPRNALDIAAMEHAYGIKATYYFRSVRGVFKPRIIRSIARMGHEIGYHYEVLSDANGDPARAIELFQGDLKKFRELCDVKSICMHGRPLSRQDNRDLWKYYDFKDYAIRGEAYLSAGPDLYYFSDTGRNWSWKNKFRDRMPHQREDISINTTDDLIRLIRMGSVDRLYILAHPERWALNNIGWALSYAQDKLVNHGKNIIMTVRR
ncbi:conserved hypothetical protein [Methanocella paludicola SANAE]|uniref:Polysaccharide deacetylase n=1 Tax=Methanocella paludicola (strain DSM 17711 / JCM 13418 / NBRC 101707 / SANAE) TaxID=304371 RepID=D1YWL7_METPS|nr:hypothetical protein [Methanocella paludicola]BAI60839.1 conserved hypothetical protein [Methanocella paludicola SANAE]